MSEQEDYRKTVNYVKQQMERLSRRQARLPKFALKKDYEILINLLGEITEKYGFNKETDKLKDKCWSFIGSRL